MMHSDALQNREMMQSFFPFLKLSILLKLLQHRRCEVIYLSGVQKNLLGLQLFFSQMTTEHRANPPPALC